MIDYEQQYVGVSRAAWGYIFLYFNININSISILPSFVGMLLFLSSIKLLEKEQRDLALLRSLGIFLTIWHTVIWVGSLLGFAPQEQFPLVELIAYLASLYFHFQLLTNFAAMAKKYQQPDNALDRRLLKWRTIQTVILTIMAFLSYPIGIWRREFEILSTGMAVVYIIAGIGIIISLFSLRTLFRTPGTEDTNREC